MAMNVSAGGGDENAPVAEINVTPLVDVMLVLLIIFMVTAPLMISQVPVTLPKANLDEMGKPVDPLILSTHEGTYYLEQNGKTSEFPEAQLQPNLDDMYSRYRDRDGKENFPVVYVRADDKAKYGSVYKLVKTLAKTGFYKVSLISEANQ